jgi:hypothetical protein
MNSFLRPDGLVFLYTPDVKGPSLARGVSKYFKVPHLYYFSLETLSSLLHKAGFAVSHARVFSPSFSNRFGFRPRGSSGSFWILARKVATVSSIEATRRSPVTSRTEHELVAGAIRQALSRDRFHNYLWTGQMLTRRWRNKASGTLRRRFPGAWAQARQLQLTWKRSSRR